MRISYGQMALVVLGFLGMKTDASKMKKSLILFALITSGCQMSDDAYGELNNGKPISGEVIMRSSKINTVNINLDKGVLCSGDYDATKSAKNRELNLECSNEVSGSAKLKVIESGSKEYAIVDFSLKNGVSGSLNTSLTRSNSVVESKIEKEEKPKKDETPKNTLERKTSVFMGLLASHVGSFSGPGYAIDVFKYGCNVSVAYKNKTNQVKSPEFTIIFGDNGKTIASPSAYMPYTLPGQESDAYAGEACSGRPIYLMYQGT